MNNNINEKYLNIIEQETSLLPPLEDRYKFIEEITDLYFQEVGEIMPGFFLEMLGTWYMDETYTDSRRNKVLLEEYPVLSKHQLQRRNKRNVYVDEEHTIDTMKYYKDNNLKRIITEENEVLKGGM